MSVNDRPDFYLGTGIDGVYLNAEQLNVRARDLNELIGSISYTESLFHILLGRLPDELERKLFDIVLVAFHGGFGLLPPTTLVPRLVAGTGVTTAQALAAGYLASGPYHVGAVEQAMKLYAEIAEEFFAANEDDATAGSLEQFSYESALRRLEQGETIGGFGHPLLRKDPRPVHTRRIVCDLGADGPFLDVYDGIARCLREKKGVVPNVDGICGAILLHLGLRAEHGTGIFLLARTAGMLAHIVEEQTIMPYQTMRRFMFLPVAMPRLFNADFAKITRFFNRLRDSPTFNAMRNVLPSTTKRVRREAAAKEQIDQAAIDEHRSQRKTNPVTADSIAASGAPPHRDDFVSQTQSTENAETADSVPLELLEDCSSPEMLAGAAFFLSGCLKSVAESDQTPEQSQKIESLISSAMNLIEQAGEIAGTEDKPDS